MNQKLEYLLGKGKRGFDRRKLNKMFSQIVHLYQSIRLGLKYIYIYIYWIFKILVSTPHYRW